MRRKGFYEGDSKAEAGPVVIVADGAHYYAEFNRAQEPFEIEEQHWPILERTGVFTLVKSEELKVKNEKPRKTSS